MCSQDDDVTWVCSHGFEAGGYSLPELPLKEDPEVVVPLEDRLLPEELLADELLADELLADARLEALWALGAGL